MAVTSTTNSDWESVLGKQKGLDSLLATGKAGIYEVSVAITSPTTYTTGGIVVDLSDNGRFNNIIAVVPTDEQALSVQYVPDTNKTTTGGKIKLYGELSDDAAGVNTAARAFLELSNGSTIVQGKTFKFLVIAY